MDGQIAKETLELTSYSGIFLIQVLGIMVISGDTGGFNELLLQRKSETQGMTSGS